MGSSLCQENGLAAAAATALRCSQSSGWLQMRMAILEKLWSFGDGNRGTGSWFGSLVSQQWRQPKHRLWVSTNQGGEGRSDQMPPLPTAFGFKAKAGCINKNQDAGMCICTAGTRGALHARGQALLLHSGSLRICSHKTLPQQGLSQQTGWMVLS